MTSISRETFLKNRTYGIIGMIALFFTGVIFGFIINGSDRINTSVMTRKQCDDLADRIIIAGRNNQPDLIEQLNKVFSENCNGRRFRPVVKLTRSATTIDTEKKLPETTCEAIEKLLKKELNDENDLNWDLHQYNAEIYTRLANNGCEKNKEMYQRMADREQKIAVALNKHNEKAYFDITDISTCAQIENLLQQQLDRCNYDEPKCRVRRAQIYANLSERGCPENSSKYKELAAQELEIARALTDDNIEQNKRETEEMVETYKRLQMQAEAEKMLDKAKKLTNPAIDFIIQL